MVKTKSYPKPSPEFRASKIFFAEVKNKKLGYLNFFPKILSLC